MAAEPARRLGALALALSLCGCPQQGWTVLSSSLDRVGLCVTSPGPGEVFVAGGGLGNGSDGLLLHLKSAKWSTIRLGTTDTLWWVHAFSPTQLFAVGEKGAIFSSDGVTAVRMGSPTTATLFGVWGASPDDVWAVGGSPGSFGANDVLLHYDGATWTLVPPPEALGAAYFKVWGTAKNDVFVVGQAGLILHYDGTAWSRQASPVKATLLTVAGRSGTDVYAVGGPPAALLHYDGTAWTSVALPESSSGLAGVSAASDGTVFVVGLGGAKWRSTLAHPAFVIDTLQSPRQDLHSTWAGPEDTGYAVGGDFLVAGSPGVAKKGVVAYFGTAPPPAIPSPLP
jgi:photosystem II stability/assembly factor-like uncharacterized protein